MFTKVLSNAAKETLDFLAKNEVVRSAYLAGGTALALQLGHRYSYDFDFFTKKKFDAKLLIQAIAEGVPHFRLERQEWGTILGYIKHIRFSLFFYKYPLLFPTHIFGGIQIADAKDIAAMKIAAIADCGTKRDFVGLYFLFAKKHILTPQEAFDLYDKKFRTLAQNKIHLLKSFGYFEDAEKESMPRMIQNVSWDKVKEFFLEQQQKLAKKLIQQE